MRKEKAPVAGGWVRLVSLGRDREQRDDVRNAVRPPDYGASDELLYVWAGLGLLLLGAAQKLRRQRLDELSMVADDDGNTIRTKP